MHANSVSTTLGYKPVIVIVGFILLGLGGCSIYILYSDATCKVEPETSRYIIINPPYVNLYDYYKIQQRTNNGEHKNAETRSPINDVPAQEEKQKREDNSAERSDKPHGWASKFICEAKAADIAIVFFTWCLVVATIGLVWATIKLWDAGERQIKLARAAAKVQARQTLRSLAISRISAEAAQKAANVAEAALTVAERPYLIPDGPKIKFNRVSFDGVRPSVRPEWNVTIDYRFVNMGRTIAFFKQVTSEAIFIDSLPETPVFSDPISLIGHFPIGPGKSYRCTTYNELGLKGLIDEPTFELIMSYKLRVFFFGYVRYSDVFGNLHTEGFCFRFFNLSQDEADCATTGSCAYNYNRTEKIPVEGFENLAPQGAELTTNELAEIRARQIKTRRQIKNDG